MMYFPVIFKVQRVVEMRKFAGKRFSEPFLEIFKKSFNFPQKFGWSDCACQYIEKISVQLSTCSFEMFNSFWDEWSRRNIVKMRAN